MENTADHRQLRPKFVGWQKTERSVESGCLSEPVETRVHVHARARTCTYCVMQPKRLKWTETRSVELITKQSFTGTAKSPKSLCHASSLSGTEPTSLNFRTDKRRIKHRSTTITAPLTLKYNQTVPCLEIQRGRWRRVSTWFVATRTTWGPPSLYRLSSKANSALKEQHKVAASEAGSCGISRCRAHRFIADCSDT